jgi:hypothetical protein
MSIHEHSEAIKSYILKQVESYALENGISFPNGSLSKNITLSREDIESIVKPPSTKKKPKRKFKIKSKKADHVANVVYEPSDYELFVSICDQYGLEYFEFYDEHNWIGPALKVDDSEYDIINQYFNSIDVNSISGTDFYIIRPTKKCENNITYKDEPIESCKLEPTSLIIPTSDDESEYHIEHANESVEVPIDIYNQPTDDEAEDNNDSGEELVLDEWIHEKTNIKYLLDGSNNLYSFQTNELIGKKLDEFTIEFN